MTTLRTEQEVRKLKQEVRKFERNFLCVGILQRPTGKLQIPAQGICKEFFKFAKLIIKIRNELGTQKRNASRSLPVMTFLNVCIIRGEGTNSDRLFTPGERNALAKSSNIAGAWLTAHGWSSSLISKTCSELS
jgi:hypothetical protein